MILSAQRIGLAVTGVESSYVLPQGPESLLFLDLAADFRRPFLLGVDCDLTGGETRTIGLSGIHGPYSFGSHNSRLLASLGERSGGVCVVEGNVLT